MQALSYGYHMDMLWLSYGKGTVSARFASYFGPNGLLLEDYFRND